MLILTRKPGESLFIGDDIEITVLGVQGNQVKFGISAPRHIGVHRQEVFERIREQLAASIGRDVKVEDVTPEMVSNERARDRSGR